MDAKTGEHHAPTAFLLGTTPALLVMLILSTLQLSGITIVLRHLPGKSSMVVEVYAFV